MIHSVRASSSCAGVCGAHDRALPCLASESACRAVRPRSATVAQHKLAGPQAPNGRASTSRPRKTSEIRSSHAASGLKHMDRPSRPGGKRDSVPEWAQHIGLRCLRSLTTLRLRCDTRALDCSNAAAVIHARASTLPGLPRVTHHTLPAYLCRSAHGRTRRSCLIAPTCRQPRAVASQLVLRR